MARYRMDTTNLTPKNVLDQLGIVDSTFTTWGVLITAISWNASQATIDTNIAVTQAMMGSEEGTNRPYTFTDHLGFPLT